MQPEPVKVTQLSEHEFRIESFGRSTIVTSFEDMLDEMMYFFTGKSPAYPGTSRYGKVIIETEAHHAASNG